MPYNYLYQQKNNIQPPGETDARFYANNEALIKLLNPDIEEHKILLAELYSYQGWCLMNV
ncbi:MAG: hypothetical protein K0B15_14680 [Lentimicrobium sp.]|nr:hypothetical protein [Lentimicrobium sp.]